jgi:glycogen debranching enzyme
VSELVNLSETTVIKAGNAFCVALRDGRLPLADDHPLGIYLADCRHLRGYELWVGGRRPRLLISNDSAGAGAVFELTNPDLTLADGHQLPLQSLEIRLDRQMEPAAMIEQISVRSHAREHVGFDLELRLDADFSPMLEIRGMAQPIPREVGCEARTHALRFAATGLDGVERSTTVSCVSAEAHEDGRLRVPVTLGPGEKVSLDVRFDLADGRDATPRSIELTARDRAASMSLAGADADAWLAGRCRVEVDDELVDRILRRSLLDLRLLASELDGQRYYAAGVPWYATLFGRDSIIAALQTLAFDPDMGAETLRVLAARLGSTVEDERDEEPGKVLHELRQDELAAAGLTPFARYYGTVDATPLFLCLMCEQANWTGSLDLFHELQPQVDEALRWIDKFGDLDGDELLEYRRRSPDGLANHGWKDSWDGVPDEHGVPLEAPVAVVEAQGYVVAAKRDLARLFELDGQPDRAQRLRHEARRVAEQIERFWLPDRGFYAMALDRHKRASRVLASNQGHLLWAGAVAPDRAEAICRALMSGASYSGWGVRTLSSEERAFNPVGYHTGTVWPHDNALFAIGLRRYGLDQSFLRILESLLDAASAVPGYRLPELFAGFSRSDYEDPVPYPVACTPQAWAGGSLPAMLIAGLGITADGLEHTLRIRRPSLPRQVSRVYVDHLRVGDAHVDLLFERVAHRAESVALTDVKIDGQLDVVLEILRAPGDGPRGRDPLDPLRSGTEPRATSVRSS